MRAVNFVEHVKLMPDANLLDPRERLLMEQRLLVLWVCLQPFSSARDLLAHEVLAQPRTYDLLARLRRDGYLVTGYLGWTQYRQQRYIPTLRVSRAARRCTTAAEESCTTGTMRKD